jgi:mono/diheme cytochrome c family protein
VHHVLKQRSFAAALSASSLVLFVAAVATLSAQSGAQRLVEPGLQTRLPGASKDAPLHKATVAAEQTALVKQYCVTCHNDRGKDRAGSLTLAAFDAADIEHNGEVAERMIRKLRAGMMPPPGARRPEASVLQDMAASFEARLDKAAALTPNPGSRPFQRLNRAEYQNAVRDLLNVDVDVTAYLPPDTISHGFDNVADSQTFSPTLMDGYLRAASQISRLAVGDRQASATTATYKISRSASQMRHIDGAPMGTRGGIAVTHTFPADGHYAFKMSLHYEPLGGLVGRTSMSTLNIPEQVEVSVNGERVAIFELNARMSETDPKNGLELVTPPIHVKAGPQRIAAAFIQRLDGPIDDLLMPLENTLADVSQGFGVTMLPHLRDFAVVGPSDVTGVSDTPSRLKIFSCRPTTAAEEESCAAEIVKKLSAQAFRGAPTAADLQDALNFYEQGRKKGGFEAGIRLAVQSILMSPRFLFRLEQSPDAGVATRVTTYRIADEDLASRLSFFLWGTVPDAELLKAAATGALKTSAGMEKQVRRMLADKRSFALSTRFASQWLRLQDLEKIHPDYLLYPQYDDTLAAAMAKETELFFDSVVREDRSLLDLVTADYSFVNERLAIHYRIPNIIGSSFQRVSLPAERRGLLGQGSILTLTSVADRTSPVQRGKWVMEVLLGTPPPPPPPNVPALDDSVKATEGGKMLSTRERMEEHRKNPSCNSCHRVIDPLGLALENFDVTGAWRIKDNEVPVDVVGDLYDGTKMEGPAGLRAALLKHSDMFLRSFTESLLTYAVGRRVEYTDMPAIRSIVRDAAKQQNRMSSFILGVVNSPAFRMSITTEPASGRRAADVAGPQQQNR